jgi:hypothetical protein
MSQKHHSTGIADQILSDLINLGVDAKRKNPEIRHACDHSIELTKPFSSSAAKNTDTKKDSFEITIRNHPEFIVPVLMACQSKNPKLIGDALKILSKIIQFQLLPEKESMPTGSIDPVDNVVDALSEAANAGADIQVKLLQLLPSFFQLYAFRIHDETLSNLLFICSSLQGANKPPLIVNTAQATFSQLLDIAFDKIDSTSTENENLEKLYQVPIDDEKSVNVDQYSYDAQRLVSDLCTLIEHHKPLFLKTNYISEDYGFEVLESLIKNNSERFLTHIELAFLLRTRVAPILLRFLSSCKDFTLMVKVSRLIFLLLNNEFDVLKVESEVTLTLLIHIISKESGAPYWKKIMALEVFVAIFKNSGLLKKLFREYDNNPKEERKNIIHDFFNVCITIVTAQKHILNTGDLIQPPSVQNDPTNQESSASKQQQQKKLNQPIGLKINNFSKVVRYIDSIDKQDAPPVPESYSLYLILQILVALSDCIQLTTLELIKLTDPETCINHAFFDKVENSTLRYKYEEIFDLIGATWHLQLTITDIFIHSTLDNELFSNCLKLLENLCYCSGILSIDTVRHSLLKYIGVCTLKLDGTYGYKSKVMSISETIVGTISSTLGHAVSNISSTNALENENTNVVKFYPRTINTRQTLCFHTLSRLAVSLGAHLFDDWKIILLVLQWISYYIDGPTNYSKKDVPPISKFLSNRDLQIIEHSLSELKKSIFNQDEKTFTILLQMAINLSDQVMNLQSKTIVGHSPIDNNDEIQPCIFNKLFYVNKVTDLSIINPEKFLVVPDHNMDTLKNYYSKIVNDRSNTDEIRLLGSRSFNQIFKCAAEAGFDTTDKAVHLLTEKRVLINLCDFMSKLSELPMSNELLVANCEAEIYLQTLETLKNIIDRYGSLIQQSWNVVTQMINFPFLIIKNCDSTIIQEKSIHEIIVSLLKSSFETLKVILDELLQCIPNNQFQVIIDSLYHFVEQTFDINISFNSVSYFWLISDYIKEKTESIIKKENFRINMTSFNELVKTVSEGSENDYLYFQYLWIYLVLKLAKTVPDNRAQVRNGSIITTFNVIASFSLDEPLLNLLYDIVLEPVLLQLSSDESLRAIKPNDLKDWMESFMNISNGVTKILLGQIDVVNDPNTSNVKKLWNGIMRFFVQLVNLDHSWLELNTQLFKNYHEILDAFSSYDQILNRDLLESLFEPWNAIKINYNFNNASLYQTSLCSFVDCFLVSVKLFKPIMTTFKFERMLMILNSCIRYPILADTRNDNLKCTPLQKAVLDNLAGLNFDRDEELFASYESLLIKQLNMIIVLPFQTRDLIIKKLGDKGVKIPTFISASHYGMKLLAQRLNNIEDLTCLNDCSILDVTKSLLEASKAKNGISVISLDENGNENNVYLWMVSFQMLVDNIVKILGFILQLSDSQFLSIVDADSLKKLIPFYIQAFSTCFDSLETTQEKDFVFKQYQILKNSLLEFFKTFYLTKKTFQIETRIIEEFISSIWSFSYFYEHDSIMQSVLPKNQINDSTIKELIEILTDEECWDVYGTTENIPVLRNLKHCQECFVDLVSLCDSNNFNHISKICLPFFMARCTYGLRKLSMDVKLLGTRPVLRIQLIELQAILTGLEKVVANSDVTTESVFYMFQKVRSLMIQLLPKINNRELENKMSDVCLKLYG